MSKYNREKRTAHRFQVLGHAQLRTEHLVINCVIRDLSQSGAKLGIPSSARIPAKSDLWLVQGTIRMPVVVKWREGEHVGIAFAKKTGPMPRPPGSDKVILDA